MSHGAGETTDGSGSPTEAERQRKRLRLVGAGIAVSGVLTVLVATISTRPHGILVFGLAGLAVGWFVLEQLQGGVTGLSLGLLTGSMGVWLWPHLEGESYVVLGGLLVATGALHAILAPQFHSLGARVADR